MTNEINTQEIMLDTPQIQTMILNEELQSIEASSDSEMTLDNQLKELEPHIGITNTKVGDMLIYRKDTIVSYALSLFGEYCDAEAQIMAHYLTPNSIYVDIGTNIGYHALAINQYVGCVVQGFEPHPYHFAVAAYNCKDKPIRIYNTALSNFNGTIKMSKLDVTDIGNYGEACLDEEDGIEVPVIRLDDVDDLVNVDVIKIDVEGFEYEVMQGGKGTIDKFRPVILFEALDRDFWQPCYDFLNELNYKHYWVVCKTKPVGATFKETEENPFLDYGVSNILAVPIEKAQPDDLIPVNRNESFGEYIEKIKKYKFIF